MILLILTKHDTLFIGYEGLLKNLTLAIRHNLCVHTYVYMYMRVSQVLYKIYSAYSRARVRVTVEKKNR